VVHLLHRLLGAVLGARRGLVAAAALVGVVLWLLVLRELVREPDLALLAASGALPLLYGLAGWRLFQLPPGVVFEPARLARGLAGRPTVRCRASGYFASDGGPRWRLLARASLAIGPDGSLLATSPPPLLGGPESVRQAFPTRGQPTAAQLRAGARTQHPEWVYQPEALGGASRLTYRSAEDYAAAVAHLSIPRAALVDLAAGWQYAGLQRWPALRLLYYAADGSVASAYLAFAEPTHCAWAQERLMGRGE
jgi:hypothetical protein